MKIYLAALWSRRHDMQLYAEMLKALGHEVTARWLEDEHTKGLPAVCAQIDLDDIDSADTVVLFSAGPRGTMFSGGGRCIEFGYALAKGKQLVLIGEKESVFHDLPQVKQFSCLEDALQT